MGIVFAPDWAASLLVLAAEGAAESVELEAGQGLFAFDATLPLQAIQFFILLFALNLFFFRPISRVVEERSEFIRSNATSAQRRLDEAKALADQYEQELRTTRLEAQRVIADAEAEANKIRNQQLAEAQAEAQSRIDAAVADLERQKQAVLATLESDIDAITRSLADKLLSGAKGR